MNDEQRRYLIFTLAGQRYALDLAQVAEVVEQPVSWPVPLAPSCYHGAVNFHGAIVAVMDLAEFLGLGDCRGAERVIVLDPRVASLAFLAESIVRIDLLDRTEMLSPAGNTDFISGELNLADGKAALLDVPAVVARAAANIKS